MAKRQCDECGREYEAKRSTSQVCSSTCRTRRARRPKPADNAPASSSQAATVTAGMHAFVEMTQQSLAEMKRDQTVLGRLTVMLAERLAAGGVDTGSSVASLAKELRATYAAATEGVQTEEPDLVDELEELRVRKLARIRGAG